MGRRLPWLLGFGAIVVVVGIMGGVVAYFWMMGPMYQPGQLAAAKLREPLAPPPQTGAKPGYWKVGKDIQLHHFTTAADSGTDMPRPRPLLVIHGGPGIPPAGPWKADTLLRPSYKPIYYHQRGCGKSTRPIEKFQGDTGFYDSMQLLDRTLGIGSHIADIERIRRIRRQDKLILLGHSFGALMAVLYAAEFPQRVAAMILVAPANLIVFPGTQEDLFYLVKRRLPNGQQGAYEKYLRSYFDFKGALAMNEKQLANLYGRFLPFYAAAYDKSLPPIRAAAPSQNGGFMNLAVMISMGMRHDYAQAITKLRIPALIIHGEKDLQPAAASREFGSYVMGHTFVTIKGAGHFPFDEQPARFAAEVKRFLAKNSP